MYLQVNTPRTPPIVFRTQTGIFHLYPHQIIYAKAGHRKIHVCLINNVEEIIPLPLSEAAKRLSTQGFFLIHRSYLININYILHFNIYNKTVKLYNGISLPVVKTRIDPLAIHLSEKIR